MQCNDVRDITHLRTIRHHELPACETCWLYSSDRSDLHYHLQSAANLYFRARTRSTNLSLAKCIASVLLDSTQLRLLRAADAHVQQQSIALLDKADPFAGDTGRHIGEETQLHQSDHFMTHICAILTTAAPNASTGGHATASCARHVSMATRRRLCHHAGGCASGHASQGHGHTARADATSWVCCERGRGCRGLVCEHAERPGIVAGVHCTLMVQSSIMQRGARKLHTWTQLVSCQIASGCTSMRRTRCSNHNHARSALGDVMCRDQRCVAVHEGKRRCKSASTQRAASTSGCTSASPLHAHNAWLNNPIRWSPNSPSRQWQPQETSLIDCNLVQTPCIGHAVLPLKSSRECQVSEHQPRWYLVNFPCQKVCCAAGAARAAQSCKLQSAA